MQPDSQRTKLTYRTLGSAWRQLPLGWRLASAAAVVWLLVIPVVAIAIMASGHALPLSVRALEAVSKFMALGVVIGAVRESRKIDLDALYLSRLSVIATLLVLTGNFIAPVLR